MRKELALILGMFVLASCQATGIEDPDVTITVQEATDVLSGYLEDAISEVKTREEPFRRESAALPCDDPPNDDPDRSKVRVVYTMIVDPEENYEATQRIKEQLERDAWNVKVNEGAPEGQLMFSASKGGYLLVVSGAKQSPNLTASGTTVCARNPET